MKPFLGQIVLHRPGDNPKVTAKKRPCMIVELLKGTRADLRNLYDLGMIMGVEMKGVAPETELIHGYWEPLLNNEEA